MLVTMSVAVQGGNGNSIENLSAKDFTVTEDGVPQMIVLCEYQNLDAPVQIIRPGDVPQQQISPAKPGAVPYLNRRLLVLYFDLTGMQARDSSRAISAAKEFVASRMQPADLVALIRNREDGMRVLEDFTDDRALLLGDLEKLDGPEPAGGVIADSGAWTANDAEAIILPANRQLAALQSVARMLVSLGDQKAVVWFTSGAQFSAPFNHAQLQATINAAVLSNVSLHPIDVGGSATRSASDTLHSLAAQTGGTASLDTQNLAAALVQAQKSISNHYLILYYSTNTRFDDTVRHVQVKLIAKTDAKLSYRQSFCVPHSMRISPRSNIEQRLADALAATDPVVEIPMALEESSSRLPSGHYSLLVTARIPGQELVNAYRHGEEQAVIEFMGEIRDRSGKKVASLRDQLAVPFAPFKGDPRTLNQKKSVEYRTTFALAPGNYTLKLVASEAFSGRTGTYQLVFTIPRR
jgi:VWFA-related protein